VELQQQQQQQMLQQAAVAQPQQAVPLQLQQNKQLAQPSGKRSSRKAKASAAAAAPHASGILQEPQQEPQKPARSHRRMHTQAPLKFKPCGRGGSLKHAAPVSKHLSQGKQVLLPAGSGMQVARGVAALASARTLMLGYSSSTGLVFQPSFPAAAAAQVQSVQQAQQEQVQHQDHEQQHQGRKQDTGQRSSRRSASSDNGIMMFVSGLPEAQLRRFEQSPLIAARYGNPSLLAGAAFARMCEQGFTAVRAAGPDAVAVALAAATHARRKLLGCGLDLAVVPMTEFVDVDSLTGPDGQQFADYDGDEQQQQQQQFEYGPGDDLGRQCVRVTVLHLMRCEPQQPWKLLPWPPAPEQQPAVQWQAEQLQMQQRAWQQQQQQAVLPQQRQRAAAAVSSKQQLLNGAVQQSAMAGGSAVGAMPLVSSSSRSDAGSGRECPGTAAEGVAEGQQADMVLQAGSYSHAQGMVARQGASVLLQKQRKNKRQLVAAAQSAAHGSKGSCSSGSGSASSQ
jgi:stage V sporulation protein SpoVS